MKTRLKPIEWKDHTENPKTISGEIEGFGIVAYIQVLAAKGYFRWMRSKKLDLVLGSEFTCTLTKATEIEAAKTEVEAEICKAIQAHIDRFIEPMPYDATFIAGPE